MADTAMLLRELSSLGIDDDEPPTTMRSAPSRPAPTSGKGQDKKRKGLFGR
jgi:hypothetical protein